MLIKLAEDLTGESEKYPIQQKAVGAEDRQPPTR